MLGAEGVNDCRMCIHTESENNGRDEHKEVERRNCTVQQLLQNGGAAAEAASPLASALVLIRREFHAI